MNQKNEPKIFLIQTNILVTFKIFQVFIRFNQEIQLSW